MLRSVDQKLHHVQVSQALTISYTEQHRQHSQRKLENAHFDATESVLHRRVTIISFIVVTSSSTAVIHPSPAPTLMQEIRHLSNNNNTRLRLAAAHVTGVQAGVADGMLVAQPGEEALQTKTVATVGRGAVPVRYVSTCMFHN
jgi:translation initiation factor 6 (eIF-6)